MRFEEDASIAMAALRQEIIRALDWLENDRPIYWKEQVRRGFDAVAQARTNLEACRRRTVADHRPACSEEQLALRNAQQRLQTAQEKVDLVRRWAITVRQEADEFRGRTGQFEHCLEGDLPRMQALLGRMIEAIAAYADVSAPSDDPAGENSPNSENLHISPNPPPDERGS